MKSLILAVFCLALAVLALPSVASADHCHSGRSSSRGFSSRSSGGNGDVNVFVNDNGRRRGNDVNVSVNSRGRGGRTSVRVRSR